MPLLQKPYNCSSGGLGDGTKVDYIGTSTDDKNRLYAEISVINPYGKKIEWHFPLFVLAEAINPGERFEAWQTDVFPRWLRIRVWSDPMLPQNLIYWAALACPGFRLSNAAASDLLHAGPKDDPLFVFRPGLVRSAFASAGIDQMAPSITKSIVKHLGTTGRYFPSIMGGTGRFNPFASGINIHGNLSGTINLGVHDEIIVQEPVAEPSIEEET